MGVRPSGRRRRHSFRAGRHEHRVATFAAPAWGRQAEASTWGRVQSRRRPDGTQGEAPCRVVSVGAFSR